MRFLRMTGLVAMIAAMLQGCVVVDNGGLVSCGGSHRLQVVDLDMFPDPVAEGQRIDRWHVTLRADGSGECRTAIRIQEQTGNDIVGEELVYHLRPGNNEINFQPDARYRFSRGEHCFVVIADIAGTPRPVDAARTFCARQSGGRRWTMK
jgi:hypothetical protein